MPESNAPQAHFWIEFNHHHNAILFRLAPVLRAGGRELEEHHYEVISREHSPRNRQVVDIAVRNGGGPIDEGVIRRHVSRFQGYVNMGTFTV
jgi:hypothetical protein